MPFLQRSKTPFDNENFSRNMILLSPVFFSRQLAVVTGMPGSGKSSLLFYAVNELDPSSFRICHIELSNPNKKALYKALAVKMGIKPAYNADDLNLSFKLSTSSARRTNKASPSYYSKHYRKNNIVCR
jgi:hypothetical protein